MRTILVIEMRSMNCISKKKKIFIQEILDLIPDVCSINEFNLQREFSTKNTIGLNLGFKNSILVDDYKDIIISDFHRLDKFLSPEYDINYSIKFSIFSSSGTFIDHDTYNKINIDSFKYIINIISSIHDKRTFTFTNILIHINRK